MCNAAVRAPDDEAIAEVCRRDDDAPLAGHFAARHCPQDGVEVLLELEHAGVRGDLLAFGVSRGKSADPLRFLLEKAEVGKRVVELVPALLARTGEVIRQLAQAME